MNAGSEILSVYLCVCLYEYEYMHLYLCFHVMHVCM
jgi:hypothetical protein